MLALHLDNILFLLFVAIAIFFQILTRAATKTRRRPGEPQRRSTSPSQQSRSPTDETDEERIRKFLEALGQPTTSKPPPPVAQRPTYQKPIVPPRVPPSPLPPLTAKPSDLPRKIQLPGQIPPTREAKKFRPTTVETAFQVQSGAAPLESATAIKTPAEAYAIATAPSAQTPARKGDIALLLRSTSGLREAIILREVFGPPRSMQPLDLVGSA
jgi:periplasmic protein TonB